MSSSNWENINDNSNQKNKKRKSLGFYFFIFSIISFIGMTVFAGTKYYFKENYISSDNIIFTSNITDAYEAGSLKEVIFKIENQNKLDIRNVKLSFEYEKGKKQDGEYNIEKKVFLLGNIAAGSNVATSTDIMFLGKEGDVRNVYTSISYEIKNGNVYEKVIKNNINISSSIVTVDFDSSYDDHGIIFNDNFSIKIKIKNNSKEALIDALLDIDLPYGFVLTDLSRNKYSSSQSDIDYNNKVRTKDIKLPKIEGYESINYVLSGYFEGKKVGENIFRFSVSDVKDNDKLLILSDIYIINTINSIFSYKLNFKQRNATVEELIDGQKYEVYLNLKNNSEYAYDNLFVELITGTDVIKYDFINNKDLTRVNPNSDVNLYFDFVASQDNPFLIKVYGNKKGETNKRLIMNEKYKI